MLVFVVLFGALAIAVTGLFAGPVTWLAARTGERLRIDALLMLGAAFAATAIMIRSIDVRPWRDLGLGRDSARLRRLGAGWCVGGIAIGVTCGLLLLVGWLRIEPAAAGSSLGAAARVTLFLLPAALSEEVLCRGYLLTVARDGIGTWGAVLATSLLFGLLHLTNVGATAESVALVALAGVFLAAVRVVYDSLYAAWTAHVAWNWVMAVPLHAPVSGLRFEAPDYRTVSAGPGWITGGPWGPEGGAAAALGMIAGLAYLYTRRRREES